LKKYALFLDVEFNIEEDHKRTKIWLLETKPFLKNGMLDEMKTIYRYGLWRKSDFGVVAKN